ncbi:MAG TPA: hypothetical protein VFT20_15880 [Candidatus Limnocylindrales bacterium]|nr:hypothetical protein [Candidatus Limnocylindrales bacterium]
MVKGKPQRRQGRGLRPHATLRNGLRVRMFEGPRLGGGVVSATPDEVLAALDRLDPDLPWKKVRDQIVPVLPRVRPFPGPDLDLVRTVLPPGILVSFAIDIGPALTHIGSDLLESWPIDRATLVATGLANLRRLADDCGPERVLHDHIGDVPIGVFQSRVGIASATLLIPDRLSWILGAGPCLLLAPMRDVLIALPADVDREFAAWLADEWEALDPNHLHLGGFRYVDGAVVPVALEDGAARA